MDTAARPGMRRKSSASNLLSTFQGNRNNSIQNPTSSTTPSAKEWDANSLFSDGSGANGISALSIPSSLEGIRETLGRRMLALAHIRQGHEGRSHWLNTVLLTPYELDKAYSNNPNMRKRAYKFVVLAMSLSNLFEMNPHTDFLRSLTLLMNEYEQIQDENLKPKMRNIFRGNKGQRRTGAGINDYNDAEPSSLLVYPSTTFPLDYYQVLISFCDILIEVYGKIRQVVGPSAFQLSGMAHSVPPGAGYSISIQSFAISSSPIYAELFPNDHSAALMSGSESPIGAHMSLPPNASGLASPPPTWSQSLAETIVKVDGRFKKIINQLLKELDAIARESIKDELASLDPLLRNMGMSSPTEGLGGLAFDFDV